MPNTRSKWIPPVLLGALLAVGCGDGSSSSTTASPVAIEDFGAFYEPPSPLPAGRPGDLIRLQEVEPLAPASRAWRVLYLSEDPSGAPIAVSGLVAAPLGDTPTGRRDVVSWAHGTKGVNDPCAPSRGFRASHNFFDIAPEIVAEGWVAVGTDFEGLGTPGVHPYLVSVSEARGQLDIVRAAAQIKEARASNRFAVWGRSQGGHASLAAAEAAPLYAPELDLVGAIAAAPAGDMPTIFIGSAALGLSFNWLAAAGLEAAWGLSLEPFYEADALAELRTLVDGNEACNREFRNAINARGGAGFLSESTSSEASDELIGLLERSSVGEIAVEVPVLVSQGTNDTVVPKPLTDALVQQMCALGTDVAYLENPDESHNDSSLLHMPEFRRWTRARFDGESASGCHS